MRGGVRRSSEEVLGLLDEFQAELGVLRDVGFESGQGTEHVHVQQVHPGPSCACHGGAIVRARRTRVALVGVQPGGEAGGFTGRSAQLGVKGCPAPVHEHVLGQMHVRHRAGQ